MFHIKLHYHDISSTISLTLGNKSLLDDLYALSLCGLSERENKGEYISSTYH